jgi:hypothetical protein
MFPGKRCTNGLAQLRRLHLARATVPTPDRTATHTIWTTLPLMNHFEQPPSPVFVHHACGHFRWRRCPAQPVPCRTWAHRKAFHPHRVSPDPAALSSLHIVLGQLHQAGRSSSAILRRDTLRPTSSESPMFTQEATSGCTHSWRSPIMPRGRR